MSGAINSDPAKKLTPQPQTNEINMLVSDDPICFHPNVCTSSGRVSSAIKSDPANKLNSKAQTDKLHILVSDDPM